MSSPASPTEQGFGHAPEVAKTSDAVEVLCGPLLNYKRMSRTDTDSPSWHGSVLLVTTPGQRHPTLSLRLVGLSTASAQDAQSSESKPRTFSSQKLYEDEHAAFWRFIIDLPLSAKASKWEYSIPNLRFSSGADSNRLSTRSFHVPASNESMRIMFHSCNGFSVGTDEDAWSGCALWKDVLRKHQKRPIHVMIGGGDQIYNDGIRVDGPLRPWCDMRNPVKRREYPFSEEMRAACDKYYLDNYIKWYSTEPFASANGSIAQINIWDDHDIIDGFGSYTNHFMQCAVFRGIGGVAHKYYLLFQHHVPPPPTTFTTDAQGTTEGPATGTADPRQLQSTFVMKESQEDPSYLIGPKPGPYVEEMSRSIYTQLGAHIAMLGIDARTERTRRLVNYPETYDMLFKHADEQLTKSAGRIKHFILLLGIPIAYPRLQWLENIFQSPVMGVVRFLNKRFGMAGGLFNNFDGNVDLLDDLDDHYTAHQHKKERKDLVVRLQDLALKHGVRITILGGDVHLAAFGRFYSRPDLEIPAENDHRYIPNVISSAITNHPPPQAVANLLARRNKIHHLDHETDETLLNLFDVDPGRKLQPNGHPKEAPSKDIPAKTAAFNHCTMPSRNYALLTMAQTEHGVEADGAERPDPAMWTGKDRQHHNLSRKQGNPRNPQHVGEDKCGTDHPAANDDGPTGLGGPWGLDVTYAVEIDHHDRDGKTQGYGLTIPGLSASAKPPGKQDAAAKLADGTRDAAERAARHV